jgi:hypothetical protein
LWVSASNAQKQCKGNFSIVVYLYERETGDLAKRATQSVWSKVLAELKAKEGSNIILIPIAVDGKISSLQTLIGKYKLNSFPVVIINDKVIYDIGSVNELEAYLK